MKKKAIIVGKGIAGNQLQKELLKKGGFEILGFVDDFQPDVLGKISDIDKILDHHQVDEIFIAMPSVERSVIRTIEQKIIGVFSGKVKIVPSYAEIIDGKVHLSSVRSLNIEDILGRPPVKGDFQIIRNFIKGKTVFITGAAGSIGSELALQVASCNPKKLICFDNSESPLFYLQQKLVAYPNVSFILGNICHEEKIRKILQQEDIDIIFHAAAYKHVPLMEHNFDEAVENNVHGSMVLMESAGNAGVANFVIVSTDKAVNPTNVMGSTKRIVEKLMEYYSQKFSDTKITAVRFGNVLGSNGSVLKVFEEKIAKGENLPVTHPDIIRYFMTVEEAAQLIILSATFGERNEIFVLDMGEAVKIKDIAEEYIRLKGLIPYEDIGIDYIGLRPGEKLFEELLIQEGEVRKTPNTKTFIVSKEEQFDAHEFYKNVQSLVVKIKDISRGQFLEQLKKLVPSFCHMSNT